MAKQMVQLLCLLVALVLTDGQCNFTRLEVKFYCKTDDFKQVALFTQKHHEITLSDCCSTCNTHGQLKTVMNHFNRTCQTFTAINAFKYQLQHYLFHKMATLQDDVVQNLTSVMIGLQSTARYLQDIAITEGTTCVKFTPTQYRKLYECDQLYVNNEKLNTTKKFFPSLGVAQKWLKLDYAITNSSCPNEVPNQMECKTAFN